MATKHSEITADQRLETLQAERSSIIGRLESTQSRLSSLSTEYQALQAAAARTDKPDARNRVNECYGVMSAVRTEVSGYEAAIAQIDGEIAVARAAVEEGKNAAYRRQLAALNSEARAKAEEFDQTLNHLLDIVHDMTMLKHEISDPLMRKEFLSLRSPCKAAAHILEGATRRIDISDVRPESILAWRDGAKDKAFTPLDRVLMVNLLGLRNQD